MSRFLSRYEQASLAEGFNLIFRCGESLEERGRLVDALRSWSLRAAFGQKKKTIEVLKKSQVLLVPTLFVDILGADALAVLWDEAKSFLTKDDNADLSIEVVDTTPLTDAEPLPVEKSA